MAKTKTPFLSLGSRGTVGGVLTSQKRGQVTILRETPRPKDPYSLNQAYQRWDYRDYAYLWTLLSNAEKQVYRTKASRYHITGFSQWMRENLNTLPNLAGRWHLDEKGGSTAYDSSKNQNNGTIYGAIPTKGLINGAHFFDGSDDRIIIPHSTTLNFTTAFSVECLFRLDGMQGEGAKLLVSKFGATGNWSFSIDLRPTIYYRISRTGLDFSGLSGSAPTFNTTHHIVMTYDGSYVRGFLDGFPDGVMAWPGSMFQSTVDLAIGCYFYADVYRWFGIIDHVVLESYVLDITEIKRRSQRRYP